MGSYCSRHCGCRERCTSTAYEPKERRAHEEANHALPAVRETDALDGENMDMLRALRTAAMLADKLVPRAKEEKRMYKLILSQGYGGMPFVFNDEDRLKDFMFEALEASVPEKENGERITARIEKCAEGDGPEAAHKQ